MVSHFETLVQTAFLRVCQFRRCQTVIRLSVAQTLSIFAIERSTKMDLQALHSVAASLSATKPGFQGLGLLLFDRCQSELIGIKGE